MSRGQGKEDAKKRGLDQARERAQLGYNLVMPDADKMDGDTELERELNAYLTKRFIWSSSEVPSDECLSEARAIIALVQKYGEPRDDK